MNLARILALFRRRIGDINQPYLVSQEDAVTFFNEACRSAQERAKLLEADGDDDPLVNIDGEANVADYTLSPRIHIVRGVRWGEVDLLPTNRAMLDDPHRSADLADIGNFTGTSWRLLTGTPSRYLAPPEQNYLTLVRKPGVAKAIHLSAYIYPETYLVGDLDKECPFREERQHALTHWMAHLAFSLDDEDLRNPNEAEKADAAFTAAFGMLPSASVQRQRREKRRNQVRMNPDW